MMKKAVIVAASLFAIVIFLLAKDWDSPELGRNLLGRVTDATGVTMTAEGFRLNLLRGVVLEDVKGASSSDARELAFSLDRLVFEHRVLPLLTGTVAVDRIVLESPIIELTEASPAASSKSKKSDKTPEGASGDGAQAAVQREGEGSGGLALEVQQIRIEKAVIVMKKTGEAGETRIEGLDFEMNDLAFDPEAGSLAGISAQGEVAVREVLFDTLKVTETKSRFTLDDARFDLPELSFRTPHGNFQAEMKIDFNPVPFTYELAAQGDPLDLNGLMGASDGFGPGHVKMDAAGAGSESKDVAADGGLTLAEGEFPSIVMFTGIDEAIGKNVVAGHSYEATEARFHVKNNRLVLEPFRFESGDARLELSGWVDLAGPIALKLSLATPREGLRIEGVGANALDLLADADGWVPVPIDIGGTLEQPRIRPNVRELASQAGRGAQREATEKATDALKGLLRRKN